MQEARRPPPLRHPAGKHGGGSTQRRIVAVGGQPPHLPSGGQPPVRSGGGESPQGPGCAQLLLMRGGGQGPGGAQPPLMSGGVQPPQGPGGVQHQMMPGGVQPPQGPGGVQHHLMPGGGQPPQGPGGVQHHLMPGVQMAQWTGGNTYLQVAGSEDLDLPSDSFDPAGAFEHGGSDDSVVNGQGYYSNMMMNETNEAEFDNVDHTFASQHSQANQDSALAPSQRPNHKRQKNFSTHEDEILVSGWLNISLDPITGKDQKSTTYWTRISEYFHKHKKCQSKRTISSLKHRWETIQRCVNKFCGCLTRIELRRKSGHTISDKVAEACGLYKSEDRDGKAFQLMHCWNILKTQPKWLAKLDELAVAVPCNKKQKANPTVDLTDEPSADPIADPSAQDEGEGLQTIALARPIGKKKAKAALIQEKKKSVTATLENMWTEKKEADAEKQLKKEQKKDERFNKAFALEQERVANDKLAVTLEQERVANEKLLLQVRSEEVQLQKKRDEERIMTMDLTALPEDQKTYYMFLRSQIMSQLSMPST